MVRNTRGVLLFEFDSLLVGLAAELAGILTLPAQADLLDATLGIVHRNRYDNLLVRRHINRLTVLRDFSPLFRLKIVRLPDEGWGRDIRTGNCDLRDRLQTPHQG